MSEHEDTVISTASEPRVEIVEETLPDGTIVRKKKTTRTITKRVLTTKEVEHSHQQQTSSSTSNISSQSSETSTHSGGLEKAEHVEEERCEKASATASATASTTSNSEEKTSSNVAASTTTTTASSSTGSMSSRLQRRLNLTDTPLYRFLAKFPLKQSPAPHQRPRPVKPVLYAFTPGWKVAKKEKAAATESEVPAEGETKETDAQEEKLIGSFDVDSLKWMVSCL